MNNKQRTEIDNLIAVLEDAKDKIADLAQDEQEKFENMTEGLQQTERGQAIEQAASSLNDAVSNLESVISDLESSRDG